MHSPPADGIRVSMRPSAPRGFARDAPQLVYVRACTPARLCAGARGSARARPGAALRRGNLGGGHRLDEPRYLLLQEGGHPLLLAPDRAGELRRLAIADRLAQRLDRAVGRDLLGLVRVLVLGILELLLGLAGAA